MQADGAVHHAHGLAELALIFQDHRKSRVHLGIVGIQQPRLVETPHGHARLSLSVQTVSLLNQGLGSRVSRTV
ncbi:hypothetical protein D3C72_1943220 [compost metagenome]